MNWERPISSPWIVERIPQGSYILDIGCTLETKDLSDLTRYLLSKGHSVVGVSLRELKGSYGNFRYYRQNILDTEFPDGAFDVVIASQVLNHIGCDYEQQRLNEDGNRKTVDKIHRWLRADGLFFICVTMAPKALPCQGKLRVYDDESLSRLYQGKFKLEEQLKFPCAGESGRKIAGAYELVGLLKKS